MADDGELSCYSDGGERWFWISEGSWVIAKAVVTLLVDHKKKNTELSADMIREFSAHTSQT